MDNRQPPTSSPQTYSAPSPSKMRRAGELFTESGHSTLAKLTQTRALERSRLPELEPEAQQLIGGVFARMKSIYGHLWSSNWKTDDQLQIGKLEWIAALRRHNFTLREVNATLDWLADNEPNMPKLPDFIAHAKTVRDRQARIRANEAQPLALPESEGQAAARQAREAAERARYKEIGLKQVQDLIKQVNIKI